MACGWSIDSLHSRIGFKFYSPIQLDVFAARRRTANKHFSSNDPLPTKLGLFGTADQLDQEGGLFIFLFLISVKILCEKLSASEGLLLKECRTLEVGRQML